MFEKHIEEFEGNILVHIKSAVNIADNQDEIFVDPDSNVVLIKSRDYLTFRLRTPDRTKWTKVIGW